MTSPFLPAESAPDTPIPDTEEPRLPPSNSRRRCGKKKKTAQLTQLVDASSPGGAEEEEEEEEEQEEEKLPPAPPPSPISHGQARPPLPPLGKIQGKVIITKNKVSAARFATKYSNRRDDDPDAASILPIFTDGSASHLINDAKDHFCSASTVFRAHPTSDIWLEHGYPLLLALDSLNAKVFGLGRGLKDGRDYIRQHPEMRIHTLYIFTDVMKFLEMLPKIEVGLWDVIKRGYLEEFLALDAELAEAGIHVEYHWVPGHRGVEGNNRADRVSKMYRPDVKWPQIFQTLPQATTEEQLRNARANQERKRKNNEKESEGISKRDKKRARREKAKSGDGGDEKY